jgi:hypothetical protein
VAQNGAEPFVMQTECLVEGRAPAGQVKVRFMHPMAREIGRIASSRKDGNEPHSFESVPELWVDDTIYQTWQEAVEREISQKGGDPHVLLPLRFFHRQKPVLFAAVASLRSHSHCLTRPSTLSPH